MVDNKKRARLSESYTKFLERFDVVAHRRDGSVDGEMNLAASGSEHAKAALDVGIAQGLLAAERACRMAGIDVGGQIFGAAVDED